MIQADLKGSSCGASGFVLSPATVSDTMKSNLSLPPLDDTDNKLNYLYINRRLYIKIELTLCFNLKNYLA